MSYELDELTARLDAKMREVDVVSTMDTPCYLWIGNDGMTITPTEEQ